MAQAGEIAFAFLDWCVVIQSDDPNYLGFFSRLYSRVIIDAPGPEKTIIFQIWARRHSPFEVPVFVAGDEVHQLWGPAPPADAIRIRVLDHLQQHLTNHFLIHAGAVSRAGMGVLLVGDAFYGKSTLTLELTQRGYGFLTDDMVAINRTDGRVYPSPRSPNIRPSSADHLDLTLPDEPGKIYSNHIFDIEELFPGQMGAAVPIGAVCILSDIETMPQAPGVSSSRLVHFWVENPSPGFLGDLRRLEGTTNLVTRYREDHVYITLSAGDKDSAADRIRALCARHDIRLLGVSTDMGHFPSFSNPSTLTPIPTSQAAIYMLQRLRGDREALLQTMSGGKPTQLFAEMAGLIGDAPCYLLSVGPLKQMADLIDAIPLPPRDA
ncbi:MAG TPA: hypothetical protein PKJ56_00130 [Promineifilum sp.]|nr:hypothetical protein [Promineifilum sp.]